MMAYYGAPQEAHYWPDHTGTAQHTQWQPQDPWARPTHQHTPRRHHPYGQPAHRQQHTQLHAHTHPRHEYHSQATTQHWVDPAPHQWREEHERPIVSHHHHQSHNPQPHHHPHVHHQIWNSVADRPHHTYQALAEPDSYEWAMVRLHEHVAETTHTHHVRVESVRYEARREERRRRDSPVRERLHRHVEQHVDRHREKAHRCAGREEDGCDDDAGHYVVVPGSTLGKDSEYRIECVLGEGTFGKVVECTDLRVQRRVAVKIIRNIDKYRAAAFIEIDILNELRKLDPRNVHRIIQLQGTFEYRSHLCLVFEVLGLSVFDFLKLNKYRPFPLAHIHKMAHQLLTAIEFMHRHRLTHTDLKPENILLENSAHHDRQLPDARGMMHVYKQLVDPSIQVIDVGSATWEHQHHTAIVSTRHYRAPEVILEMTWSYPCDLWSIGCILCELYTGDALFDTRDDMQHLAMMERVLGPMSPEFVQRVSRKRKSYFKNGRLAWPDKAPNQESVVAVQTKCKPLNKLNRSAGSCEDDQLFDLIGQMLQYDPDRRITAHRALQHPFFGAFHTQPAPLPRARR